MVKLEDKNLIREVTNLVYREFGLNSEVITSKRDRDIVDAKNMTIYLVKRMTGLSFLHITNNSPIINRKISANRHGYQLINNLINNTNEFKDRLEEINRVIAVTPTIGKKYKNKHLKRKVVKYLDVLTTTFDDHMILLPIGNELVCLDYPSKPEMVGRVIKVAKCRLKSMKYRPELSPLSDNHFFKEYIKYNRL